MLPNSLIQFECLILSAEEGNLLPWYRFEEF